MEENREENWEEERTRREEERARREEERKEKRGSKITLIVIFALLIILVIAYFLLKHFMPEYLFSQGKKYYNIGQYERALHFFNLAADAKPFDDEPVYYQALTLSKLPPTYEHQKQLFDISQLELDDNDRTSQLAEDALYSMRRDMAGQFGDNYADNILYDDLLMRWNNKQPITYSINNIADVPPEYIDTVKEAFMQWQTVTNGEISFKETMGNKDSNISVNFVDDIPVQSEYDPKLTGKTTPVYDDHVLKRMDVAIKKTNERGIPYDTDKLYTLALHEIGHALGLGSHSFNEEDVMFWSGDRINDETYRKDITDRDLNTIRLLYKMIPDVIDIPIDPKEYNNYYYHYLITWFPGENYEREIQRLLSELQYDRRNIVKWVDLAITYAFKRQYARSNYILENIIPLVTTDLHNQFVVLYNIAANYYKMRNYTESSKYLHMAESIQSDFDTQLLDAFLDVRYNKLELAKMKLAALQKKYPDNIDIALKIAEIFHLQKNIKAERESIDAFIRAYPKVKSDRRIRKYMVRKKTYLSLADVK